MAGAPLVKTRWPGIYRRGDRYAYEWTDADGMRRRGSAATVADARAEKALREQEAAAGDRQGVPSRNRMTVAAYALELFGAALEREPIATPVRGRYQGRRGAIRDATLAEYRRDIERYLLPVVGDRRLTALTAPDLKRLVSDLAKREDKDYLADRSLRRIFAPISAMLATAVEEGLIPHNVARDVRLPSGRDQLRRFDPDEQDDVDDPLPGKARAMTREQLSDFLTVVDPRWRLFFELLAVTGVRVSEAIALRWVDLRLDGAAPVVRVRRRYVRNGYGPPKSRHGRRDVPLSFTMVRALRQRRAASEWPENQHLVFPSQNGEPIDQSNLRHRTLEPAREEAGIPWAGFHAFRHTAASMLIDEGRNIVQVSRWLGHHAPSFTLDVYSHLMDAGVGEALDLQLGHSYLVGPLANSRRKIES